MSRELGVHRIIKEAVLPVLKLFSFQRDKVVDVGVDLLIPEIFIESNTILSPILCRLFNFMYNNAVYPDSWTRGIIVPVPKKGNINDINNYRGITLTSIFSKIFSILLDNRLRKWSEENNLLSDLQYGFRKNRSTIDCVFVLNSIINKLIIAEKRKLYCAFIDFRKAFDMVYRNGIWFKLLNSGVSSKMVNMLQSIYKSVKSCVKVNGHLTDYFESYMGVKQGEPLSPLMFILFLNDISSAINDNHIDSLSLDEIQIFMLLFADDTVIFSYSKEGLQILLNNLHDYCTEWGISVNIDKTVVMVFKSGNRPTSVDLFYGNDILKNVSSFTYLGVTLTANGKFYQTQKALATQANKALFSLNSLFEKVSLNVTEKLKLFDTMILPVLTYGSEVWGFHAAPDIERVHLKFMKRILGVRPQTTNVAIYGELGRVPLNVIRKKRILKYWFKIIKSEGSLINKLFKYQIENNYNNDAMWADQVKNLLSELGFSYLWQNNNITELQLKCIIQRLYDQYFQKFYSDIRTSTKLSTYNLLKNEFVVEKYITCVTNDKHRIALTRLRCSAHKLAIEEGRFRNIDRAQRKCNMCNLGCIENEYHFLLICPFYRDLRISILPRYYNNWPTQQKFLNLMKSSQTSVLKKLAKYVYMATARRETV